MSAYPFEDIVEVKETKSQDEVNRYLGNKTDGEWIIVLTKIVTERHFNQNRSFDRTEIMYLLGKRGN
jgi:hypothetical protein